MVVGVRDRRLVRLELDLQQRLGFRPDARAVDVDPAFVTDEPRAGFLLRVVLVDHLEPAGVGEHRAPRLRIVREAFLAVRGLALHLKRLGAKLRAAPIGDVQVMHAPVRDEAGAVIPDQVPIRPGNAARIVRLGGRRSAPHLPIETVRHRLRLQRPLVAGAVLAAGSGDFDGVDLAQVAMADQFAGLLELALGPLPSPGLKHPFGPADRIPDLPPFIDRYPQRLLAVHVLPRLGRGRGDQRMPMVLRGDHHGVDVLAGQQLAIVAIDLAILVAIVVVHDPLGPLAAVFVRVAYGDHAAVWQADERLSCFPCPCRRHRCSRW